MDIKKIENESSAALELIKKSDKDGKKANNKIKGLKENLDLINK